MKILYITPNNLKENSGGGLNVKKIYLGLKGLNCELYVYSPNKLNETFVVASKTKLSDILSRAALHSNYMYIDWIKNRNKIYNLNPDVVILSNSRLGFIAKDISKKVNHCKIITQFDNIEYDYCEGYMNKYNGIKKIIYKIIEKDCVYKDERDVLMYSDYALFLTNRDKARAQELYNFSLEKSEILPICLESRKFDFKEDNSNVNLVFLASLWYEPNNRGILWFIKNVWTKIYNNSNLSLTIGGKNPSEELLKYNNKYGIRIHPNFSKVEDIVSANSIFISPIFEGAGMKVKVAEALSMGLRVIATDESLVGYEEVLNEKEQKCILKANSELEFIDAINKFSGELHDSKSSTCLFLKYYSIDRAYNALSHIIDSIY